MNDERLEAFLVYVAYSTMMKRYGEQEISTEGMAKEIWAMYKWNTKESSEDNGERVDSVVNAAPKQDINDKFVKKT